MAQIQKPINIPLDENGKPRVIHLRAITAEEKARIRVPGQEFLLP